MTTSAGDETPDFPLKGLDSDPAAPDGRAATETRLRWLVGIVLAVLFVLYAWMPPGHFNAYSPRGHYQDQYNLLTDGMMEGHLYLKEHIPPGLIASPDPYNPHTNGEWRYKYGLWDQSYFEGHCYLYFGVAPVMTLYLPFRVLTGGLRVSNQLATLIYTFGSLLFATGILLALRRRYFRETPPWMTAAAVALIGTANLACYLLSQSNIYQVAVACGMCFSVGAVYFLVRAIERSQRRTVYLVLAGSFLACAAGSRPHFAVTSTLLFGATAIALWQRGDATVRRLAAITVPLSIGGGFLGLYNFLRFGNFLEFGARYQLAIVDMRTMSMFGVDHIPSTMYFMFLQPPTLNGEFPYVHPMPKLPTWLKQPNGFLLERVTGLLTSTPFLWIALIALAYAAFRPRRGAEAKPFPRFELGLLMICATFIVTVLSMTGGTMRYLADFATLLDLSAVIAWFYLDQRLALSPKARLASRSVGLVLILISVAIGPMLALPPPRHYMDG